LRRLLPTLALLLSPLPASAQAPLVVAGSRIEVGEIVPSAPDGIREIDVGPAPPPGATALLDRDRVVAQIRAAGADPSTLKLSRVLRVVGAAKRWSPAELGTFVEAAVEAALPRGVRLLHVEAKMPLVAAPDAVVGHAVIPKPPRHAGVFRTAVVVPIVTDGQIAMRVTVNATLDVSEGAARPDIARGSRITLVIERRSSRVGAAGIALADSDVGETADFRVDKTGRIVRARIDSMDLASVVSP
jgi:flagella basal body P-ring formation protein FlgA